MAGGLNSIYTTIERNFANQFFRIIIFFDSGGLGGLYPLPTPERETLPFRVYMAARSRLARRVASTVWPCRSKVKSVFRQNICTDYGQTGPGGSMENLPAYK